MFPEVRSRGFVNTYMLGRLIIQKHFLLIVLSNGHTFGNLSELLKGLLSARCKYRLHSRNQDTTYYGSLLVYALQHMITFQTGVIT